MLIRNMILTGAALAALGAMPAAAQQAAASAAVTPTAGAQVLDAQGGAVGTVASVSGQTAVIDTGTNQVAVPFSSFGKGPKGLLLGMTKAELDAAATAAAAQAKAQFLAKLTAGTQVADNAGAPLGTIEANDGTLVTLARGTAKVKLPIAAFGPSASGGVQIGMTGAELDAAAQQAGGSTSASGSAAAGSGGAATTTGAAAGAPAGEGATAQPRPQGKR